MRRNDLTNLVFLSTAQTNKNGMENKQAHFKLQARIEKLFGKENVFYCQGTYKGVEECSLGVIIKGEEDIELLEVQAANFKQESILHVDNQGQGTLIYTKRRIKLGAVTVTKDEPSIFKENFTYIPMNESYFWFNK